MYNRKKFNILACFLVFIFAFFVGVLVNEAKSGEQNIKLKEIITALESDIQDLKYNRSFVNIDELNLNLLNDSIEIVKNKFVDPEKIENKKISEGLVRGFISSLEDPYSSFMTPEESQDFENEMQGDLEGIGAELTVKNNVITVVSPLKNSPAKKSGLLPEDIIIKVDEEEVNAKEFRSAIYKIRGEKGTEVVLNIFRPSTGEIKDIKIIRDKIKVETVYHEIKDNIAVIEITQFGNNTTKEFEHSISEVIKEKPKGIILDLRFNSGGLLTSSIDVISAFRKNGVAVSEIRKNGVKNDHFVTGKFFTDLPLVVIQNKGSASASEIVSGGLQYNKRAIIIGDVSFGKGSVQELIPMNGGAHLKVTVAKWFTPDDKNISEEGIIPDILVKNDFGNKEIDHQMNVAIDIINGKDLEIIKNKIDQTTGLIKIPTVKSQ